MDTFAHRFEHQSSEWQPPKKMRRPRPDHGGKCAQKMRRPRPDHGGPHAAHHLSLARRGQAWPSTMNLPAGTSHANFPAGCAWPPGLPCMSAGKCACDVTPGKFMAQIPCCRKILAGKSLHVSGQAWTRTPHICAWRGCACSSRLKREPRTFPDSKSSPTSKLPD